MYKCKLLGHKWSQWSEAYDSFITKMGDFGRSAKAPVVMQDRQCTRCGIIKPRKIREGQVGFTLIELLVVTAIIGILVAVIAGAVDSRPITEIGEEKEEIVVL